MIRSRAQCLGAFFFEKIPVRQDFMCFPPSTLPYPFQMKSDQMEKMRKIAFLAKTSCKTASNMI
jgi:hypothetical protein